MFKLKNKECDIQFAEMNIKQRLFEKKSYITLELKVNFYPNNIDEIVYGSIDITVDCEIKSLDELENNKYKEGKVVFNLNEDGVWNSYNFNKFDIKFKKRVGNTIKFEVELDEMFIDTDCHITSLYTVGNKDISDYFDMKDFHENPLVKEFSNKQIFKYYTKK